MLTNTCEHWNEFWRKQIMCVLMRVHGLMHIWDSLYFHFFLFFVWCWQKMFVLMKVHEWMNAWHLSQPRSRREDEKLFKIGRSRHHGLLWKTMEKPRKRNGPWNRISVWDSVLCVRKVHPTMPVLRRYF